MHRTAKHIVHHFGILLLLFLLSPIDTSYAATECMLIAAQGCFGQTVACAGSRDCCQKKCPLAAAHKAGRLPAGKTCPLKYSVTKSFDPAVTGKTRRTVSSPATMVSSLLQAALTATPCVNRLILATASPPDIVILQRNLRI